MLFERERFLPAKPAPRSKAACIAYFHSNTTRSYTSGAIQMSMAHTQTKDPAHHRSTYNYTSPVEDLASFLIVRGPHAWCAPSLDPSRPTKLAAQAGESCALHDVPEHLSCRVHVLVPWLS